MDDADLPKTHLILHVPFRMGWQGNPRMGATCYDEHLNKQLKALLRGCHQALFEEVGLARGNLLLRRVKRFRQHGE